MTTCYVIMSAVNKYLNVEDDYVYQSREEAEQKIEELKAQWNAKDDYYIRPMWLK